MGRFPGNRVTSDSRRLPHEGEACGEAALEDKSVAGGSYDKMLRSKKFHRGDSQ